jgi:tetratricopeptide (TPR) repeat protein
MYGKAAELSPQDGNLWLKYARSLNRVADRQQTIKAARKAAQLLPDNAEAQGQFGLLAAENQERAVAHQALLRAHQLEPNSGSFLAGLVAIELEMGTTGEAEKHVRAFLERHPQHPESNFFMAVICRQKPHTKENVANAIKHGEKALSITRPTWRVRLYELLGGLYLETSQSHKAVKYYEMGRKLNPNSPTMASGLMRAYAASGQVVRSQQLAGQVEALVKRDNRKTYLKHALGFSRKDTRAALELAHIFELEKDYGNARATYELAINESAANSPSNKEARQKFTAFLQRMQKLAGR